MSRSVRERVGDWVALAKLRRQNVSFPETAPTGGDAERVFIGPTNSAGQGYRWARALECARPSTRVTSMAFQRDQNPFKYLVDQSVPSAYAAHSIKWQRKQREALLQYRAGILESAQPPFSRLGGLDTVAQLAQLQDAGVQCALLFHGSDIREPAAHMAAEPNSHFGANEEFRRRMETTTARSREVIAETGLPVFVSTPDLLSEVEGAMWLPVVISVDDWEVAEPPLQHDGPPKVVHVPSSSFVKGTDLIESQLRTMHEDGEIEYRQVTGIPHADMPNVYRDADIVIDQFRVGNYGVAACEALATGRVVVSHVSDEVRRRTSELTGTELPILEALPNQLREVLRGALDNRPSTLQFAERGPAFVRSWHDGTRSGELLVDWLKEQA